LGGKKVYKKQNGGFRKMFEKLSKPKEWLRLGLMGLIILIVYGLLSTIIPPIFAFGFAFAGITFSLGVLVSAIAAVFVAELVIKQLDLF
jgi:drug/metabolite transporter superfamily protein YnfA